MIKKSIAPDIDDFTDVPVVEFMVSVGNSIAKVDTISMLESDKATIDIPVAGTITTMLHG